MHVPGRLEPRGLGETGLTVTPVGLGLAALGRPGYVNLGHAQDLLDRSVEGMRAHSHTVLDAAADLGIGYLDVARSYGRAEEFLASWLAQRPAADRPTVGSKWGYTYTARWRVDAEVHEVKDHGPATFDRQIVETRERLGDALDLYQVHSATLETGVLEDRAVLSRLLALSEEGVVVGLTTSGRDQAETLRRALEVKVDGANPFRCVQATWNVLEPSVGAALAEAHDAGWGVIVKEGVANGRLTPRGPDAGVVGVLEEVGEAHGVGPDAVALAAVLAQPFVDVALSGAATAEHLRSNTAAAGLALDGEELERLAALAEDPADYWQRRSSLDWT